MKRQESFLKKIYEFIFYSLKLLGCLKYVERRYIIIASLCYERLWSRLRLFTQLAGQAGRSPACCTGRPGRVNFADGVFLWDTSPLNSLQLRCGMRCITAPHLAAELMRALRHICGSQSTNQSHDQHSKQVTQLQYLVQNYPHGYLQQVHSIVFEQRAHYAIGWRCLGRVLEVSNLGKHFRIKQNTILFNYYAFLLLFLCLLYFSYPLFYYFTSCK